MLQADLAHPRGAQQLFQRAVETMGQSDILVNNAGTGASAEDSLDTSLDDCMRVLNTDLVSPWVLCQAAARASSSTSPPSTRRSRRPRRGLMQNVGGA